MKCLVGISALVAATGAASAQTVTLTFEDQNNTVYTAPIVRSGYRLGNPVGQEQHFHEITSTQFGLPNNGTGILLNDRDTQQFLRHTNGGNFRLRRIDVASALNNNPATGLRITGFRNGVQTGVINVPALGNGYTTVAGAPLGLVDEVIFDGIGAGGGFCLDNATLSIARPPVLYACDQASNQLWIVNPATAALTPGPDITGAESLGALAYDPATDTMYGASTRTHELYRIDYNTGVATLVGNFGLGTPVMHGLEWDSSTDTLYGTSYRQPQLFEINTATGIATAVGPTGFLASQSFGSLGYNSTNDVLFIVNTGTDTLHRVNRGTGAAALVGPLGAGTQVGGGLAFDPVFGMLACDANELGLDNLFRINLATGAATLIGNMAGAVNILGLAFVADGPTPCYPDCDTSTGAGILDIFDFLCFQNRYDAALAYACNCDTSTGPNLCDIFDFLCFQNAYDAGCP